ncbi:MAG: TonB family protein [Candidatus Acidiferrales bacterium]
MSLRGYIPALALAVIFGSSALAQTILGPGGIDKLPTIPLNEAEQHLIERQPPRYPAIAKAARVQGTVELTLEVDAAGAATGVLKSDGPPLLVQAAADAARQYRYRPFEINGAPADVLVEAVVRFSLGFEFPPAMPFPEVTDIKAVVMTYNDGSFSVQVRGDGFVEYDAAPTWDVVVQGKHQRRVNPEEVQSLLKTFQSAGFFSMRNDYSVGATDVGTTTTSIQVGDLRKAIRDDWVQVPPPLKGVQQAILKYSHSDQWTTGNADTVPDLIEETRDPAAREKLFSDLLPRAAVYADTSVVRAILAQPVDLDRPGPWGDTALMLAADRGLPDMVDALLKAGANPRALDREGRNALIFGAGSGNAEVLRLLLAARLRANEKDTYGDTPLMAAAASGNPESVRLLLKHGAKVNARNQRHQTALLSGATGDSGFSIGEMGRRHAEIPDESVHRDTVVDLLLDAGANINARGWDGETALFTLEDDPAKELIRHHINLEIRDKYGETALIRTVSDSIAELLIKAGADVNAHDNDGNTALIQAAENNFTDKLEMLVKAPGIRVEQRNNKGETALMKAKAAGLADSIRVLVAAGASQ